MDKHLSPYKAVTDRLHEGMPFVDHAGIAAYDNDARWLQAALPRFDTPKADMYPHLSPYANRACNPTRYLDPSGEDCVAEFNDDNITVRADFYALESDYGFFDQMRKAAQTINDQSNLWAVKLNSGNKTIELPIIFQVTVHKVDENNGIDGIKNINMAISRISAEFANRANGAIVVPNSSIKDNNVNANSDGRLISITEKMFSNDMSNLMIGTLAHEMGHNLGMTHDSSGLMTKSPDKYRTDFFSKNSIYQIIHAAKNGTPNYELKRNGETESWVASGRVHAIINSSLYLLQDIKKGNLIHK